jgi:hypothetical protein
MEPFHPTCTLQNKPLYYDSSFILGTISNGGHIEIQDGGHCGYYRHVNCIIKWYKSPSTVGKLRFHGSSFLLCIESGYVEWHAFTVVAILNMAAT